MLGTTQNLLEQGVAVATRGLGYISRSWLRKKDILIEKGQFQEIFPGMPSIIFLNLLGSKLMENHV